MFQPTNESFIRGVVEASIDRHVGESEVERLLREGKPYRPSSWSCQVRQALHRLGHRLMTFGRRLEYVGAPQASWAPKS